MPLEDAAAEVPDLAPVRPPDLAPARPPDLAPARPPDLASAPAPSTCDLDGDGYERDDRAAGCPGAMNPHPGLVDCNDEDRGVYPGVTAGLDCGGKDLLRCVLRGYCPSLRAGRMISCAMGEPRGCLPPACDADGDHFIDAAKKGDQACDPGGLLRLYDCDDRDVQIFPGAPERCGDGIDQDCDGRDQTCLGLMDADGDRWAAGDDCDDTRPGVHPFAVELCNGADDDCDGLIDEGNPDGAGRPMGTLVTGDATACTDSGVGECAKPPGHCVCGATIAGPHHYDTPRLACPTEPANPAQPGAAARCQFAKQPSPELCDGLDNDCDPKTVDTDPPGHRAIGVAVDCPGPLLVKNVCCGTMGGGARCVDPLTDPDNCGGCGISCRGNHVAQGTCLAGSCRITACEAGWADCDLDPRDGCEVNALSDPDNCGRGGPAGGMAAGCGVKCSSNNIALRSCTNGVCGGMCLFGWADCDNNKLTNGCETSRVNLPQCGTCGLDCPPPQACVMGMCK